MKTNKEMINDIIAELEEHNNKKPVKKSVITFTVVFSLIICMCVAAGASGLFRTGSPEFIKNLKIKTENAATTQNTEELRKRIAESDDIFSVASRNDENFREILLDRSTSIPIDMTVTNDDYIFCFKSITEGKKLNNVHVRGSLADGSAEFEWQVIDSVYALFEITRVDKEKLTDKNYAYFRNHNLVDGYPAASYMTFTNDTVYYQDDYTYYMAVELNSMLPFAGKDFIILLFDGTEDEPAHTEIYSSSENGKIDIKESFTSPHAVFRFNIDEKYADKEAIKELKKQYPHFFE